MDDNDADTSRRELLSATGIGLGSVLIPGTAAADPYRKFHGDRPGRRSQASSEDAGWIEMTEDGARLAVSKAEWERRAENRIADDLPDDAQPMSYREAQMTVELLNRSLEQEDGTEFQEFPDRTTRHVQNAGQARALSTCNKMGWEIEEPAPTRPYVKVQTYMSSEWIKRLWRLAGGGGLAAPFVKGELKRAFPQLVKQIPRRAVAGLAAFIAVSGIVLLEVDDGCGVIINNYYAPAPVAHVPATTLEAQ